MSTWEPAGGTLSETESVQIFLRGSEASFRCHCGANVFTQATPNVFRCNGCEEEYEATR